MKKNIKIIGAGPSGLTAAINLAMAGYKVEVYEKNKDVGIKLNGDFQGLENWTSKSDILDSLKKMNIKINFPYAPLHSVKIYDCDLNKTELETKKPFCYLIRRGNFKDTLDIGLKKQAEELGVKIIYRKKIKKFKGKNIVAIGSRKVDGIGVGITFDTKNKDDCIVFLDDRIAPKAYAYLLINNGKGTLVTCMFKTSIGGKKYFEKALGKFKEVVDLDMKNVKHFGGFVNFFIRDSNYKNEKFYVGECAGFQDYLWGFGMRYAITSGYLAAKSIIEDKDYDKLWKKEFKGLLETSLSNRFLFERLGNSGYKKIISLISKNPLNSLYKNYNPSFIKKIILPFAKIKYKKRIKWTEII